jgi:steroid delta-isomerase-like uncharacterized protein
MSSKNVETMRAAHESWNRRDFEGCVHSAVDNLSYEDHARGQTIRGKEKFREWVEMWAKAMSDGKISKPKYTDAGDVVIAEFTCEGKNDGPFGSLPPTGRHASFAFCEICHFDKNGRMISGGCYYDLYSLLTQLGHLKTLPIAA